MTFPNLSGFVNIQNILVSLLRHTLDNKCILYTKTNLVSHYNETKIIAHKNYLKNNNSTLLLHGNI